MTPAIIRRTAPRPETSRRSHREARVGQARKWRLVTDNVDALVDWPRHRVRRIHPLSPDQARTLLDGPRRDISRTVRQSRAMMVEAREPLRNAATVVA